MSPETASSPTKICPTCGTRLAENATRCVVCGSEFSPTPQTKSQKAVQGTRMPELTLSLPAAMGLLAVFVVIGAITLYFALQFTHRIASPTPNASVTPTVTPSPTPTDTLIPSDTPTYTPLPPKPYTVQSGDTCISIAALFKVSPTDIIQNNNLNSSCTDLVVGQVLQIPQPTPTPLPAATPTLESGAATLAACNTVPYTVQANNTLSSISTNYNVPMEAIQEFNGLTSDQVFTGTTLNIPLCMRAATPGPSPTPTAPPPYPAPNLLLPAQGTAFTLANDTITLQWSSIGTLRDNERYYVVVEDVTSGTGRKWTDYVTDTKDVVPVTFRPQDNLAHAMTWTVVTVRQTGTDDQGNPIYTNAGATSDIRIFTWSGLVAGATATP
jgi:LysM repeat protein